MQLNYRHKLSLYVALTIDKAKRSKTWHETLPMRKAFAFLPLRAEGTCLSVNKYFIKSFAIIFTCHNGGKPIKVACDVHGRWLCVDLSHAIISGG